MSESWIGAELGAMHPRGYLRHAGSLDGLAASRCHRQCIDLDGSRPGFSRGRSPTVAVVCLFRSRRHGPCRRVACLPVRSRCSTCPCERVGLDLMDPLDSLSRAGLSTRSGLADDRNGLAGSRFYPSITRLGLPWFAGPLRCHRLGGNGPGTFPRGSRSSE